MDFVRRARAAGPNHPAPGVALVNLYGSQQDWKDATAAAAELAEQFPTSPEALDAKGRVQLASGDKEGAVATYKRLHEIALIQRRSWRATWRCSTRQRTFPRHGPSLRRPSSATPRMAS